jgi:hypothetical protein
MWGVDSFHVVNLITFQEMSNSQYFPNNVLTHFLLKIFLQGRQRHARRLRCHPGHFRVHFSKASEQLFTENEIVRVPHPPYSPDLAPSDFGSLAI